MSIQINDLIKQDIEMFEVALKRYIENSELDYKVVCDAMKYSIDSAGKRLRPVLVLEFCRACGGKVEDALPFACAIEMIHTYSLIHDDLPCMDDDDMRRGKPSCHITYGEQFALLAGDALLTLAFETASSSNIDAKLVVRCINELAKKSGINGMVGGQTMDLQNEGKEVSLETLKKTDLLKTGALIECCAVMGCICANAEDEKIFYASKYAQKIGIAFQIMDDILNVIGDSEKMGKPVGNDDEMKKSTYVSILGLDKAKEYVEEYTNSALESLQNFDGNIVLLQDLANTLKNRDR